MSTTRLRRTAAAVALAVLALTGCSNQAGAASVVGDQQVTDSQVAAYVDELSAQLATIQGATLDEKGATSAAVIQLTDQLIYDAAAAREGIVVTPGQVDQFLSQLEPQNGGTRASLEAAAATQGLLPASELAPFARGRLVYQSLADKLAPGAATDAQQRAVLAYMTKLTAELGVEAAPRYGTWKVLSLGPVPDDLSFVPASPTPGGASVAPLPAN